MKKIFLIICLFPVSLFLSGQKTLHVDTLLSNARGIYSDCEQSSKKKVKFEKLKTVYLTQDTAIGLLQDSINSLNFEIIKCKEYMEMSQLLFSSDSDVFTNEIQIDAGKIPAFMQRRYNAILKISQYCKFVSDLEQFIKKAVSENRNRDYVKVNGQAKIDDVYDVFVEIKNIEETEMCLFSDAQRQSYQNYKARFNAILDKYIFVE